jgi:AcrR family transcriptional regulator
MARPIDHARRQELLDGTVDYALVHGVADLSLRPLAAALGTQAPVLLHHFGSKEQLLAAVLNGVRDRLRALGRDAEAANPRTGLGAVWAWASDPAQAPFLRLFFECYGLALRHPDRYGQFLDSVVQDWLDEPMAAIDETSATIAIAVIRGLVLDLLTTGDRARVDAAMARVTKLLRAHAEREREDQAGGDVTDPAAVGRARR